MSKELGIGEASLGGATVFCPELDDLEGRGDLRRSPESDSTPRPTNEQKTDAEPLIPGLPESAILAAAVKHLSNPVQRWK